MLSSLYIFIYKELGVSLFIAVRSAAVRSEEINLFFF